MIGLIEAYQLNNIRKLRALLRSGWFTGYREPKLKDR